MTSGAHYCSVSVQAVVVRSLHSFVIGKCKMRLASLGNIKHLEAFNLVLVLLDNSSQFYQIHSSSFD